MNIVNSAAMTPPTARRRGAGFTLVELMVVVAIIGTVGAMGVVLVRRALNANKAPSFARTFLSIIHDTRHAALANGHPSRLTIIPGTATAQPTQIVTEILDPADATKTNWVALTTTWAPQVIQFCIPQAGVQNTATTPTCPITTTSNQRICFSPNGRVNLTTTAVACPGTGSSGAKTTTTAGGATVFLQGLAEGGNDVKYKVMIYGLTGMAKMTDSW
jgi:prepilin-type N-terminal cleavage/methylation domain-containing protein